MGNSLEGGRGESAQTEPAMHTETSSPSISKAPRVGRKSWLPGPSEPGLGSTPHTVEVGGQGLGQGTVGAFQNLTSAPAHWLSPSVSVASDKEVPPHPQETLDNNPDTSGAALAEDKARGVDAPALRRLEIRAASTEPEPEPADSPGRAITAAPPMQGLDSIFPVLLNVRVPSPAATPLSHTEADSTMPLFHLNTVLPILLPRGTAPVPPFLPPGQQAERTGDAASHTDPTLGSPQSLPVSLSPQSSLSLSTVSLGEGETHSMSSTEVNSQPAYVATAPVGGPRGKYNLHSYYQPRFISPFPGTRGQEVTERQSFDSSSSSTLRLSQGQSPFPESAGTMGMRSWTDTDLDTPARSLFEDTTGTQQVLKMNESTEMIPGSIEAEGTLRLFSLVTRSLSEDERSDVPLPEFLEDFSPFSASTEGPTGTVASSLDSSTKEEVAVSPHSADTGSSYREVPSTSPSVETDTKKRISTLPDSLTPTLPPSIQS